MAIIICNSISLINVLHSKTVNESRSICPRDRTHIIVILCNLRVFHREETGGGFNTAMLQSFELPSSDK